MNWNALNTNARIVLKSEDIETAIGLIRILWKKPKKDARIVFNVEGVTILCREDEALHLIGEQTVTKDYPDIPLRKGDVVLDIGANVGFYSIRNAKKYPARFLCYEPFRESYELLEENAKINKVYPRVTPICVAVDRTDGERNFYIHGNLTHSLTQESTTVRRVHTSSFDKLVDGTDPYLVKMDVEGAEYDILMDSQTVSSIPHLLVEIHDSLGQKKRKLVDFLIERMVLVEEKNNVYYFVRK